MPSWTSPDGKITKEVLREGLWGSKPSEACSCTILSNLEDLPSDYVIGDSCNELERCLDVCLITMHKKEKSKFSVVLNSGKVQSFEISLVEFTSNGLIYEWNARKKCDMATKHKEKGVELFKEDRVKDAAYRFDKGLKLVLSIPLNAEVPETEVDGVGLEEINRLKENLYNNLGSCHFKRGNWGLVKDLCGLALGFNKNNVKALYRLGVACKNDRDFEKAEECFVRVLELEPDHKACGGLLRIVKAELRKAQERSDNIVKKMFM